MRHVILTCKNHPELRWSCKDIAFDDEYGYNGSRNLFFKGTPIRNEDGSPKMYSDGSGMECDFYGSTECACSPRDLVRAPEDHLVTC